MLNNRGVAQMGQQFTEKAEGSFAEAMKADPKLAQAAINDGIALMSLQKLDAAKAALQKAIELDPKNAQAWYNLGLAQHAGNELDEGAGRGNQIARMGCDRSLRRTLIRSCFNPVSPIFRRSFNHASSDRPRTNAARCTWTGDWQSIDHELRRDLPGIHGEGNPGIGTFSRGRMYSLTTLGGRSDAKSAAASTGSK